jgi:hypothetical protein
MAKPVTHISVFLASPSDVETERGIAFDLIHEWNDLHTNEKSASLQIRTWKTSAYPELGERPQSVINRQVLDDCDILVGVFWTRFGLPTGIADSGTEEEIRRSMAGGKPVLLYFSDVPASPSQIDPAQYAKVLKFRDEFRNTGLIWKYTSHDEFRSYLRRHLERHIQNLLSNLRTERIIPTSNPHTTVNIGKNEGIAAHTINNVIYKTTRKKNPPRVSATGTIGSDMLRKNYVSYLVRQYNQFLKIGRESFGDARNVSYSFLSTRIIQTFKSPANDLPINRFDEVVGFIKGYINDSIVGRNNRSKGWKSYDSFEEFCTQQLTPQPQRKRKSVRPKQNQ